MTQLLAIDPGPKESAFVLFSEGRIAAHDKILNGDMLDFRRDFRSTCVIEMIGSMGMAVGAEVFETVFWIGRFFQVNPDTCERMSRGVVKMHLCGSMRAKDGNIRQALIDRYSDGSGAKSTIGTKKNPGPLYGFAGDQWQALALGVTYAEQKLGWHLAKVTT